MKNWALLLLFTASFASIACMPPPKYQAYIVTLFDAQTGKTINYGKTTVKRIYQFNCIGQKCTNKTRTWKGEADPSGQLLVPRHLFSNTTTILVKGYQQVKLKRKFYRSQRRIDVSLKPLNMQTINQRVNSLPIPQMNI